MQLRELIKLQNCQKKLKKLLVKYKSINDIIIFGSFVKGKNSPGDVDLALILNNELEIKNIKKDIRLIIKNVDIEIVKSIHNKIWLTLIKEGFSVKKNKFIFEIYNIKPVVLYKYSLKKLDPTQKVQFTRGIKNFLKDTDAKILSRAIVLVPLEYKSLFEEFLEKWGLVYEVSEFELLPILRKPNI